MNNTRSDDYYLIFKANNLKLATNLENIERIINIVEISPIPAAPKFIQGVINVGGEIIPIISLKKKLNLRDKKTSLSDIIIIANNCETKIGFIVDEILNLQRANNIKIEMFDKNINFSSETTKCFGILDDSIILIQDLKKILTSSEKIHLTKLLSKHKAVV